MLSREYCLFTGIILLILGILGLMNPDVLGTTSLSSGFCWTWILTGIVSLLVGFTLKNINSLRTFSGLVGALYLVWAMWHLFSAGENLMGIFLPSLINLGVGALGLASALAPAYWMREKETYAPNRA